jgi:hypothetical protein
MTNKIAIYKNAIAKADITDIKEFMTWQLKGWNSFNDYSDMSIDEMIATDIEMFEIEAGHEMSKQDIVAIVDVHANMFINN